MRLSFRVAARPWATRRIFPGTFYGPGEQVFVRKTAARLPILEVFGPSLAREVERDLDVVKTARQVAQETFEKRMGHELRRVLPKPTTSA